MQSKPDAASDSEIIRRVLQGEVNAFALLLARYKNLVLTIVKKHVPENEVEETAQTAMVKAYQSLSGFDPDSDFKKWVSSITVKTCYDYWRKTYRTQEVSMSALTEKHREWLEEVVTCASDVFYQDTILRKEASEVLDWALGHLSAEDRMAIELVYLEGMSGKETAELLGWSAANVKIRTFRARKKLRKLLSAKEMERS